MSGTDEDRRRAGDDRRRFCVVPTTRPGRRAVALAAAFVVLLLPAIIAPGDWTLSNLLAFLCGLAGGILALRAILAHGERAVLAFVAVLPLLFTIVFLPIRWFVLGV